MIDIYKFINSKDIARHCRNIKKTWDPYEMAVIIGRSYRPMKEKFQAWTKLIEEYPDMPTPKSESFKSFPSLHEKLTELIAFEKACLDRFLEKEDDAVYRYKGCVTDDLKRSPDFKSIKKALSGFHKKWKRGQIHAILMEKKYKKKKGHFEYLFNYDGEIIYSTCFLNELTWLTTDFNFDEMLYLIDFMNQPVYVDIPTPFKIGDALICKYPQDGDSGYGEFLIFTGMTRDYIGGWGYSFDADEGYIYKLVLQADCLEYYRGKKNVVRGKYVSRYLKNRRGLDPVPVNLYQQFGDSGQWGKYYCDVSLTMQLETDDELPY